LSGTLAVFDLDGTITRRDTLGPFLWGYLRRYPRRLLRLLLATPAPFLFLINRDRGALKGTIIRAALGGLSRETLEHWTDEFVQALIPRALYAEAVAAIARHRAQGDRLLMMSASTDLYVPRIAQMLGFDEVICSRVRWQDDGRLDGRLSSPNCRGQEKRHRLAEVVARDAPDKIYAYGNSGSDLPHMALAHESFLVNAPARLTRTPRVPLRVLRALRWQEPAVTLKS
jgi:phosphatidylglycerophosphatase C